MIHTDDTRVPVQDRTVKGKCKSGRIWTYLGDGANPLYRLRLHPRPHPRRATKFLADYKGYLQADAYGGYDGIYHKGLVSKSPAGPTPGESSSTPKRPTAARRSRCWQWSRQLYAVEDAASRIQALLKQNANDPPGMNKSASPCGRSRRADPGKDQSLARHRAAAGAARSPMAPAIGYTLNQWDALNRYTSRAS